MKYRVEFFQDNTYQVIDVTIWETVFQGNLSDCEAYIRLKENDNVDF